MLNKQIKYGAFISYVSLFVNIIIGLVYTPWMISSIGKSNYGLYTLAMSLISLFVFDFGLSNAITRFVSKYIAENQYDRVNKLLGLIYKLYLLIDVVILIVIIILYFFIPGIYKGLTPEEVEQFKSVYIIAGIFCVISFPLIPVNGILSANELFVQIKTCDLIHKLLIVISMSVCLLCGYGLMALILVNAIAGLLVALIKLIIVRVKTNIHIDWHFWNRSELCAIASFSGWVTVSALAQRCIFNLAPTILGILSNSKEIAVLGVATTIEQYTYTFASALNGLFLPQISRIVAKDEDEMILPLMVKVGRFQILVIGLICIGFIAIGKDFIQLWVGADYDLAYYCSVLFIVPCFFYLPQEIGLTTLVVKNEVKRQSFVYLLMAAINIVLAIPLTMEWGALGLAVSIFIAYTVRTIGLDVIFKKYLHINVQRFFAESFCQMSCPLIISLILCVLVSFLPITLSWSGFAIKIVLCVVFYSVVMYLLGMKQNEKALIHSVLKRFLLK